MFRTRKDHDICWNYWPSIFLLSHEILVNPSSPLYMVRNIWIKKAKIVNSFVRQKATCMPRLTPCSSKKIHEGRLKIETKYCSSEHNTRSEESNVKPLFYILASSVATAEERPIQREKLLCQFRHPSQKKWKESGGEREGGRDQIWNRNQKK